MRAGEINEIKQRLDELNEIPEGFHFDQEAVWQRLELRLKNKPEKKKKSYILVYVAAACLLIILLELWSIRIFADATQSIESTEKVAGGKGIPKRSLQSIQNDSPAEVRIIMKQPSHHNKPVIAPQLQKIIKDTQLQAFIPPLIPGKDSVTSIPVETVKTTPVKTKREFPIAHINELPGQETRLIVVGQGKTRTADLYKKKNPIMVYEAPYTGDEKIIIRKKPRGLLNLKSSSQ